MAERYPSRAQDFAGLKKDQFIKIPKSQSRWCQMHTLRLEGPHRPGKSLFSWSDNVAKVNSNPSSVSVEPPGLKVEKCSILSCKQGSDSKSESETKGLKSTNGCVLSECCQSCSFCNFTWVTAKERLRPRSISEQNKSC